MSSPKRRRLSDASDAIGLGESARSPPLERRRRPSSDERQQRAPAAQTRRPSTSNGVNREARQTRRNPLAEPDDERVDHGGPGPSGAAVDQPAPYLDDSHEDTDDDEEEHCAVCLSPISNKVRLQ